MSEVRYIEDDPHNWGPWNPMTGMRRCLDCCDTQSDKDYHQYRWVNRTEKTTGIQLVSLGGYNRGEMIAAMTTVNGEVISQEEYGGAWYSAEDCAKMREEGRLI